jgi:hypothetical protein
MAKATVLRVNLNPWPLLSPLLRDPLHATLTPSSPLPLASNFFGLRPSLGRSCNPPPPPPFPRRSKPTSCDPGMDNNSGVGLPMPAFLPRAGGGGLLTRRRRGTDTPVGSRRSEGSIGKGRRRRKFIGIAEEVSSNARLHHRRPLIPLISRDD